MGRLAKAFLYLVYIVVVGGLLTAIIWNLAHDKLPKPVTGASQVATHQASPKKSTPTPSSSTPSSSQSSESSSTAAGQAANNAGNSTNSSLANTGPGNTIALFVGATLCGTLLYRKLLIDILK